MKRSANGAPYLRVLLATALFATSAFAQMIKGTITGTVSDATGAAMTDVAVKATNTLTGISRETKTNETGSYRMPGLDPGTYTVEFVKSGFETKKAAGLELKTAQEVTINPSLAVATAATQIEVVEQAVGVELAKTSATIERTYQAKVIDALPVTAAERDVTRLALLAPTANRGPGSTGISANGQRARNNNFMIDGVDNNDPSVTISNLRIIPEAVAEMQVQTSPYSAEFGRASGAQISLVTKSGTNSVHGEVFDYFSGHWLEPLSLLNKRAGLKERPRFNRNQAGGALRGPAIKNKLFYSGLIEANRFRQAPDARNASPATIPTPDGFRLLSSIPLGPDQTTQGRQATLGALGFLQGVYQLNPGFTSIRNVAVNGTQVPFGNINIPLANPVDSWYVVGRADYQATSYDSFSYRFIVDNQTRPDWTSNLQFGPLFTADQITKKQNHMGSYTRTISSNATNEFRFAFVKTFLDFPERDPKTATTTIAGAFTIGGLSNFPQGRDQKQYQFQDTFTYIKGRHTIKTGFNLSRLKLFNNSAFSTKGVWNFDNFADYLNSRPAQFQLALDVASFDARQTQHAYFIQDDFKLKSNLTLNLGMRYEVAAIPFGAFGATDPQIRAARVPGPARPDRNNWGPRIGFAYSPNGGIFGEGKTVIRGGYGMTYDYLFFNILTVNASNFPRVRTALLTDRAQMLNQYPSQRTGTAPGFSPLLQFVNSPENLQSPTAHIWSASFQREIGLKNIVEVGYSGTRNYHGIRQGRGNIASLTEAQAAQVRSSGNAASIPAIQARRDDPAVGDRVSIESTALGFYHAVFLKYDRKLAQGLMVGGNYTYSRNMSDNDESLGVAAITGSSPQIPQDFRNYRPEYSRSVFDRPHRFAVHWLYETPWFKTGMLKHPLGGWSVNGFWDAQSGQPFTIFTGVDTHGNGSTAARPDLNAGGTLTRDPKFDNLRTFTIPSDSSGRVVTFRNAAGLPLANTKTVFGNLPRNTFRGPTFQNWNLSLSKKFSVTERISTQIRFDMINALNHRNFGNPVANMASPAFGTNTSDPGARSALAALKVLF